MGKPISILAMAIFYLFLFQQYCNISASSTSMRHNAKNPRARKPCKTLVFYFHDILYDGHNSHNATSAIVGAPAWGDKLNLGPQNHFGTLIVFDDPITVDDNLHSRPVGRAQGLYMYDSKKVFTAWFAFTFVLNSTQHKGTITFAGADPVLDKTKDIPVVGGTGDFFMARGIATVTTGSFEGNAYFRLRTEINFYECW